MPSTVDEVSSGVLSRSECQGISSGSTSALPLWLERYVSEGCFILVLETGRRFRMVACLRGGRSAVRYSEVIVRVPSTSVSSGVENAV